PANPEFTPAETAGLMSRAAVAGVVYDPALEARITEACTVSGGDPWRLDFEAFMEDGLPALADEPPLEDKTDPDAVCVIVFTSGSSGSPKGAMHSQRSIVLAGESFIARMHLQPDDRLMVILPMFHVNALFYSVAGALAAAATLLIEPRFSASMFWHRVRALRATEVNIIEAIATILLSRPDTEYEPGHTLNKVYGTRDSIMAKWRARFGGDHLVGGYAMTEIPGILSTPYDQPNTPGSMGVLGHHPDPARSWAQCRVVDEQLNDVPDGTPGELMVRTPTVMKGYFNDPEATAAAFAGEWFRTRDLVRRESNGAFFFLSRMTDIIRRRGENVAGAEIDRVLAEDARLAAAAAIGVPSEFGDEDILVAAVRKPGVEISEDDVRDWCKDHLAPTKVPRFVLFLDSLPLTPTHKVAKAKLRADTALRSRAVDFGTRR
ncbi:MAG: AMP-binding protein, partial [Pigmentiphaga sp.]